MKTTDVRVLSEKEKLTDGSYLPNVYVRWNGGFIKVACQSDEHAEELVRSLKDAAYVDVTVYAT